MILESLALVLTPLGVYKVLRRLGVDKSYSALVSAFWLIWFYVVMKYLLVVLGAAVLAASIAAPAILKRVWRRRKP